jgi:hypothetical protein
VIDDAATSFPVKLSQLPAGRYRAQARFDLVHQDSAWRREDGNLYSKPVAFEVPGPAKIDLTLDQAERCPSVEPKACVRLVDRCVGCRLGQGEGTTGVEEERTKQLEPARTTN